ncbi:MAG: hypothetical protein WCO90_08230 [Planctomycetota bacterium]
MGDSLIVMPWETNDPVEFDRKNELWTPLLQEAPALIKESSRIQGSDRSQAWRPIRPP